LPIVSAMHSCNDWASAAFGRRTGARWMRRRLFSDDS
jgi:hypothetical protein